MKRLIFALSLFALPAHAVTPAQLADCKDYAGIATVVMAMRQAGYSFSEVFPRVAGNKLAEAMAIDAYDFPRATTKEKSLDIVIAFKENVYRACVKVYHER